MVGGAPRLLPWTDRRGRFSRFKATAFVLCCAPALWLLGEEATIGLGGRPVHAAILFVGLWTVRFLLLSLAVTPARTILDAPKLMLVRRMIGVTTAVYVLGHLTLYAAEQGFQLGHVVSEIARRIYLTIGFVALVGLVTLAATSTDGAIRRLGRAWKRLHRLVYGIAALGLLHFFMQSKSDVSGATTYAGVFAWLMLWRAMPRRWGGTPWALAVLALAAGLATAGIEAAWYGLATPLPWRRVLAANWHIDLDLGLRPAAWIVLAGLAVAIVAVRRSRPHIVAAMAAYAALGLLANVAVIALGVAPDGDVPFAPGWLALLACLGIARGFAQEAEGWCDALLAVCLLYPFAPLLAPDHGMAAMAAGVAASLLAAALLTLKVAPQRPRAAVLMVPMLGFLGYAAVIAARQLV